MERSRRKDQPDEARTSSRSRTEQVDQLVSALRAALPEIVGAEPVDLAYLHGSAATGLATSLSDVDIAIVIDEGMPAQDQLRLMLRLQRLLDDAGIVPNADVRVINEAPIVFQGKVVTGGILLFARSDETRIAYEEGTRQRYFDFLPVHRRLQEAFFADLQEHGLYGRSG